MNKTKAYKDKEDVVISRYYLNEEDQEKYKTTHKTNMKTIAYFPERDYMDALSYIGVLPE